jgi:hypothetical protein
MLCSVTHVPSANKPQHLWSNFLYWKPIYPSILPKRYSFPLPTLILTKLQNTSAIILHHWQTLPRSALIRPSQPFPSRLQGDGRFFTPSFPKQKGLQIACQATRHCPPLIVYLPAQKKARAHLSTSNAHTGIMTFSRQWYFENDLVTSNFFLVRDWAFCMHKFFF